MCEESRTNLLGMGFSASRAEVLLRLQTALNEESGTIYPPRNATNTTPTTLEEFARDAFVPAYQAN